MSGRSTAYSKALRAALAEGASIVIAVEPHTGEPVDYRPRTKGDPLPWLAEDFRRYNGKDCKPVSPNGGGPWAVARLLP